MRLLCQLTAWALALEMAIGWGSAVRAESPPRANHDHSKETSVENPIDLNSATISELCDLPGIGQTRANAIVTRRKRKPFRRTAEIMRIRGIGRATYRRLRALIMVRPSPK